MFLALILVRLLPHSTIWRHDYEARSGTVFLWGLDSSLKSLVASALLQATGLAVLWTAAVSHRRPRPYLLSIAVALAWISILVFAWQPVVGVTAWLFSSLLGDSMKSPWVAHILLVAGLGAALLWAAMAYVLPLAFSHLGRASGSSWRARARRVLRHGAVGVGLLAYFHGSGMLVDVLGVEPVLREVDPFDLPSTHAQELRWPRLRTVGGVCLGTAIECAIAILWCRREHRVHHADPRVVDVFG